MLFGFLRMPSLKQPLLLTSKTSKTSLIVLAAPIFERIVSIFRSKIFGQSPLSPKKAATNLMNCENFDHNLATVVTDFNKPAPCEKVGLVSTRTLCSYNTFECLLPLPVLQNR